MDNYEMKRNINSYVSDIKTRNHIDNPYVPFSVDYYVVKSNNEVIVSPSDSVLNDFEWGLIAIYYCYGRNYRGYYEGRYDLNFITKEGIIVPKLRVNDLEVHSDLRIYSTDNQFLYAPADKPSREDEIQDICKIIPIIQGCKSKEQADMMISIKKKYSENSNDENIINTLMEEISRLRKIINNHEKRNEQILSLLSTNVTDDEV